MTSLKVGVGVLLPLLLSLLLLAHSNSVRAQVQEHQISDDGNVHIPLQFPFPYYGRVFTDSWMFSNGVIGFMSPQTSFCCTGEDLNNPNNHIPQWSWSIMPLWTDLTNYNGRFWTESTPNTMTYGWENISEFGRPNSRNTFDVMIDSGGGVQFNYVEIDVTRRFTQGMTGDLSQGQYQQFLHEPFGYVGGGVVIPAEPTNPPINICDSDPLADPSCPGYADALFDQQCSFDPLTDPSCDGYQQAYYDQQCSYDPLYDSTCNGYADAYYDQQCGLDPLYDVECNGYTEAYHDLQCSIDPLYDSTCFGYEQAYYNQQCSINPLYDSGCFGYAEAYYDQQCSLDPLYDVGCNGYADAYYELQCSLDPLYDTQCSGYTEAYYNLQCTLDALYDSGCNGYEKAYASWQLDRVCSANSQADPRCPNYVTPSQESSTDTVSTSSETINTIVDTEEIGMPSATGDATVDSVLRELTDVPTTTIGMEVETVATVETQEETQETEAASETDATEELVASVESESENDEPAESDGSDDESSDESEGKDSDGRDSKYEKQDSKKEKVKKMVAQRAANLANEMSNMASLEAQQAVQAQVLALINYVPDFNTYNIMMNGGYLPDATGYPDTNVPESRRGLRNGLAQQLLHEKMVEMQYER